MTRLTPAQTQAITTHDRSCVVVAGAGSGKTHVLVERYIALLEAHPDWSLDAVVAITFTRKAASEMRDRVRRYLQDRATTSASAGDRLAAMDSARISTIHSLCATLLRANAAHIGVDPAFTVLDETDALLLRQAAVESVVRALTRGDAALLPFDEGSPVDVLALTAALIADEPPSAPDDLLTYWRGLYDADVLETGRRLRAHRVVTVLRRMEMPDGDKFAQVCSKTVAHIDALPTETAALRDALIAVRAGINFQGGSAKSWGSQERLVEAKAYVKILRESLDDDLKRIGDPIGAIDARAADLVVGWARLLRLARDAYQAAKRDRAALDNGDLERLAGHILTLPAVGERYRLREFKALLVDEFQDTNAAQWAIVNALAQVASGDRAAPGNLFLVGDPKQSIYGFRGADVGVFLHAGKTIRAHGGAAIDLARSFRTHAGLVARLNAFFSAWFKGDPDDPDADPFDVPFGVPMDAARSEPPDDAPPFELLLVRRDKAEADDAPAHADAADDDDDPTLHERAAAQVADRIHDLIASGARVWDKAIGALRPATYGDVALLFPARTHLETYEAALKAAGLPYLTYAGSGYFDRQEIDDVIHLLMAVVNPHDDLALTAVLRAPFVALSDDSLYRLRTLRIDGDEATRPPLRLALTRADAAGISADDRQRIADAIALLDHLSARVGRVSVAELLREALDRSAYPAILLTQADGARKRLNVEKLVTLAQDSGGISLGGFIERIHVMRSPELRESEATIDADDVIRLMTVHSSKGLEFPIVIIADAGRTLRGRSGDLLLIDRDFGYAPRIWDADKQKLSDPYILRRAKANRQAREAAESKRLLYVALTRAGDRVILSGGFTIAKKTRAIGVGGWLEWCFKHFGLTDELSLPLGETTLLDDHGEVRLTVVDRHDVVPTSDAEALPTPPDAESLSEAPTLPLIGTLPAAHRGGARPISATQLAHLGAALLDDIDDEKRAYHLTRWRQALGDDPASVSVGAIGLTQQRISQRLIGEIVHEVIRRDDLSHIERIVARLRALAWEYGITNEVALSSLINRCKTLIRTYTMWRKQRGVGTDGRRVYRELPFTLRLETGEDAYLIHGAIDLLYESADGWWLIDHKTSVLNAASQAPDHARRFLIQVGVYASAVEQTIGVTPHVGIYYLAHDQLVTIAAADWRAMLKRLGSAIGDRAAPTEETR